MKLTELLDASNFIPFDDTEVVISEIDNEGIPTGMRITAGPDASEDHIVYPKALSNREVIAWYPAASSETGDAHSLVIEIATKDQEAE